MTPDNEAIVRNLRDALDHDLPADMRQGIQRTIEFHTGRPDPTPEPPTPLGPAFVAKVTINGEPFDTTSTPHPLTPWSNRR
jgi:hypothetical protein